MATSGPPLHLGFCAPTPPPTPTTAHSPEFLLYPGGSHFSDPGKCIWLWGEVKGPFFAFKQEPVVVGQEVPEGKLWGPQPLLHGPLQPRRICLGEAAL